MPAPSADRPQITAPAEPEPPLANPHQPTPSPPTQIARLFPPNTLPTGCRAHRAWIRKAPYPPHPERHPPRATELAALFHHFAVIHLLAKSRNAIRDHDYPTATLHAHAAADIYAQFIHTRAPCPLATRSFVDSHLAQLHIAPFHRRIGYYRELRFDAHYLPPPDPSAPFVKALYARIAGAQPFFRRPPDNPDAKPYDLAEIHYPPAYTSWPARDFRQNLRDLTFLNRINAQARRLIRECYT